MSAVPATKQDIFPEPGTLVFFAGSGWLSRVIALRTCTLRQLLYDRQWISHVGVVFDYDGSATVCESTTLDSTPCCVRNVKTRGVQAHPLWDRIREYHGRVWIARPRAAAAYSIRKQGQKLTELCLSKMGTPYDEVGCLLTGLSVVRHLWRFNPSHCFCSELVAWIMEQLDVQLERDHAHLTPQFVLPAELAREAPREHFCHLREATGLVT